MRATRFLTAALLGVAMLFACADTASAQGRHGRGRGRGGYDVNFRGGHGHRHRQRHDHHHRARRVIHVTPYFGGYRYGCAPVRVYRPYYDVRYRRWCF